MSGTIPGEKHFTASAFIVTKESPKRVLLLHHKKLNSWLQVGGHVERSENPIEAIVRETREEAGIDISFLLKNIKVFKDGASELQAPRYFLEERIPAHKDEPEHFHLDMFYVVEVPYQEIALNVESNDIRWFTYEETQDLSMIDNMREFIKRILA